MFADRLTVKRLGFSYIIQISFELLADCNAPRTSRTRLQTLISLMQLQAKFQAARTAGVWLHDRLRELGAQASDAERAVVDFKAEHGIVPTGGSDKRLVQEQQVAELTSQLVIARAQVSEARARLDRIQTVVRADLPTLPSMRQ